MVKLSVEFKNDKATNKHEIFLNTELPTNNNEVIIQDHLV